VKSSSNGCFKVLGDDSISIGFLKNNLKSIYSVSHFLMYESFDVMHIELDVLSKCLKEKCRSVKASSKMIYGHVKGDYSAV